jgi:hypothetical protein
VPPSTVEDLLGGKQAYTELIQIKICWWSPKAETGEKVTKKSRRKKQFEFSNFYNGKEGAGGTLRVHHLIGRGSQPISNF